MLMGSQKGVTLCATDTTVVGPNATGPMDQGGGLKTTSSTIDVPSARESMWTEAHTRNTRVSRQWSLERNYPSRQGVVVYFRPK
jgi:hypothetical protein